MNDTTNKLNDELLLKEIQSIPDEELLEYLHPEDFAMELLMQYLIRYCTPRNNEHHLTIFFEPRLREHASGLKEIWDKTEHQKVKEFLGQLTAGYYAEAAEYVFANDLWTDHSKYLTGFSARDIMNRHKDLKK